MSNSVPIWYGFVATEQMRAFDLEARRAEVVGHIDVAGRFFRSVQSVVRSFF